MPEFNPAEPFEAVTFDPSQPFDVGFDSEQPFDVGIERIPAQQGPRLPAPESFLGGKSPTIEGKREEQFQQVQSRPPEWAAENFNRLQEALPFAGGGEEGKQAVIEKAFGDRATLAFHEGLNEHVVKFDTGEVVPYDPAGIGEADIRGMRAGVGRISGEILTGAPGLLAGGVGAALTAPLGAGAAELRILQMGKDAGLNDFSQSEINIRAAEETLMAYIGEAIFGIGGAVYRRILASPQAKRFLVSITDDEITEAIKRFETTQASVKEAGGGEIEATAGQKLIEVEPDVGRKVQTFERGLEAAGEDVGRAVRKTQQEAEESLTKRLFGPAGDASELGEAVQKVAAAEVGREAENIAEGSIAAEVEATARREIDVSPTYVNAEEARVAIKESRDKIFNDLGKRYDDFWKGVPAGTEANLEPLRKTAKTWSKKLEGDVLPSLTEESKVLVKDALSAEDAGLDQVSRAISTLKAEARIMDAAPGMAKAREKKLVIDLIDSLEEARGEALEGVSKGMRDELADIDRSYRVAKETLDLGLVNRLVTKSKSGGFRVADNKFFGTILDSTSESRNVAALLASPEFAATGGSDVAKEGIMGFYRDKVVKGTMTHAKFMSAYGDSLRQFYSPQEMRRFSSLEKAESHLRLTEKREKELLKELKQSFEYKLGRYDPEDVLDKTAGKLTKTKKLKELLSKHPDKWRGYQQLRSQKLLRDVQSRDDANNLYVNSGKIADVLGNPDQKAELTEVFGQQYVNDLGVLAEVANLRKVPKAMRSELTDALKETDSGPLMMAWRSGPARPLSRAGLLTTSGSKLYRSAAREATAKLLQNPKLLQKAMGLYNRNASWKQWRRFWLNIGAIELVRAMEEENPELK